MNADEVMAAELRRLCGHQPELSGALLAGLDGLLIASDLPDPGLSATDAYHLAALAAASIGLGHRFADALHQGPLREYVFRSSAGCVVTYPAGHNALLVLLTEATIDLESLRGRAHAVARWAGDFFDAYWNSEAAMPATPAHPPPAIHTPTPMTPLPIQARPYVTQQWRRPSA